MTRKNKYQSVRYIDINSLNKIFKNNYGGTYHIDTRDRSDSDSSTDDEISGWFQKKNIKSDSDSDFFK